MTISALGIKSRSSLSAAVGKKERGPLRQHITAQRQGQALQCRHGQLVRWRGGWVQRLNLGRVGLTSGWATGFGNPGIGMVVVWATNGLDGLCARKGKWADHGRKGAG
jgi:hypothetical protein